MGSCIVDVDEGGGQDYSDLATAISTEATDIRADAPFTFNCRATSGTADVAATLNGFDTTAANHVVIQATGSHRWTDGGNKYPTGNQYKIEVTNETALSIQDDHVRIYGIAIKGTGSSTSNVYGIDIRNVASGSDIRVGYCYIQGVDSGMTGGYFAGIYVGDWDAAVTIFNCVINDWYAPGSSYDGFGILFNTAAAALYIYNTTIHMGGGGDGIYENAGSVDCYNCAVFNSDDDFVSVSGTIDYCASDDGDGTNEIDWTSEATDWAQAFTDYANGDFSVKTGADIIGAGTDDPGSGLYSDDIAGTARSSTWDMGAFEYAAGGASVEVTPGQGSLTVTGQAPTVAATANQEVTPGQGSLSMTGYAPTVTASDHQEVTPGQGALTVTGQTPTVAATAGVEVTPGQGSLTVTGQAATVAATANQEVTPGQGSLTVTGQAPDVAAGGNQEVTPSTGSLLFTANLPTVTTTANVAVTPALGSLALTGKIPTVTTGDAQEVTPGTGSLTLTGQAPTVSATANFEVTPGAGSLVMTGQLPTVAATANQSVTPSVGTLTLTAQLPEVVSTSALSVTPGTGSLMLTGKAPDLKGYLISWNTTTTPVHLLGVDQSPVALRGADTGAVKLLGTDQRPSKLTGS